MQINPRRGEKDRESEQDGERAEYIRNMEILSLWTPNEDLGGSVGRDPRN